MNNNNSRGAGGGSGTSLLGNISPLKKVVLLVDVDPETRESRAKIMRTLGVTVHCASSARGARSKMDSGAYNLILVDLGTDSEAAETLVQEIRLKHPRQLVAFLVGSPLFVAKSLRKNDVSRSRVPQPIVPSTVSKVITHDKAFNFGQKIRDAQGEEVA